MLIKTIRMIKLTCPICKIDFNSKRGYSNHIKKIHKMESYDFILKYVYSGIIPLCKCGCGKQMNFFSLEFSEYAKGHNQPTKLKRIIKLCPVCNVEFETIENKQKETCSPKCAYKLRTIKSFEIRNCVVCGKEFKVSKINNKSTCSFACSRKDINMWNKVKNTMMEKYGVDNYSKTPEFLENLRAYNLNKYNVEYSFQSEEVKSKIKQTNIERHGVENPSQNKEIKQKKINKSIEQHGEHWWVGQFKSKTKKSKIELHIKNQLNITDSFIYNGKEFDFKVGNDIFEIDGDYWHENKMTNLTFQQLNGKINDKQKMDMIKESEFKLYRIFVSNLPDVVTIESLKENSYIPNYDISEHDVFLTSSYLLKYETINGIKKLLKYEKMILKFVETFFNTTPNPKIINNSLMNKTDISLMNLLI